MAASSGRALLIHKDTGGPRARTLGLGFSCNLCVTLDSSHRVHQLQGEEEEVLGQRVSKRVDCELEAREPQDLQQGRRRSAGTRNIHGTDLAPARFFPIWDEREAQDNRNSFG